MDQSIKAKTIKLLEENIGEKLQDIEYANDFLAMTLKLKPIKEKNMLNYIKIKSMCTSKDTS